MVEKVLEELLGPLHMNLERAGIAYRNYMADGRKFMYALILRESNANIRNLLVERGYLLSDELQKDALLLLEHLDVWTVKWDDLQKNLDPALEDAFVFSNSIVFPRDAVARIEEKYRALLEEFRCDAES